MIVRRQHQKLIAGMATQLRRFYQANDTGVFILYGAATGEAKTNIDGLALS